MWNFMWKIRNGFLSHVPQKRADSKKDNFVSNEFQPPLMFCAGHVTCFCQAQTQSIQIQFNLIGLRWSLMLLYPTTHQPTQPPPAVRTSSMNLKNMPYTIWPLTLIFCGTIFQAKTNFSIKNNFSTKIFFLTLSQNYLTHKSFLTWTIFWPKIFFNQNLFNPKIF